MANEGISMTKALDHRVRACRVESCRLCVGSSRYRNLCLRYFTRRLRSFRVKFTSGMLMPWRNRRFWA